MRPRVTWAIACDIEGSRRYLRTIPRYYGPDDHPGYQSLEWASTRGGGMRFDSAVIARVVRKTLNWPVRTFIVRLTRLHGDRSR